MAQNHLIGVVAIMEVARHVKEQSDIKTRRMIQTLKNMREFGAWGHDHAKLLYELEKLLSD